MTWDVDRRDRVTNGQLRLLAFGSIPRAANGRRRAYEYAGFVHRDSVYYRGQSVLLVEPRRLRELLEFLGEPQHRLPYPRGGSRLGRLEDAPACQGAREASVGTP